MFYTWKWYTKIRSIISCLVTQSSSIDRRLIGRISLWFNCYSRFAIVFHTFSGLQFIFFFLFIFVFCNDFKTCLWIRFVSGSINFFPSRGSKGVKAPNCKCKEKKKQATNYNLHTIEKSSTTSLSTIKTITKAKTDTQLNLRYKIKYTYMKLKISAEDSHFSKSWLLVWLVWSFSFHDDGVYIILRVSSDLERLLSLFYLFD